MPANTVSLDQLTYEFPKLNGEAKLRELIVYIARKCTDDPMFGATKLNKILFFADFISYLQTGEPITGVRYMHLPKGPAPQRMKPIRDDMIAKGEIDLFTRPIGGFDQHRVVANRQANIDEYFKPSQIALLDQVISALWGRSAADVSLLSHQNAWKVFKNDRQPIPYEAALLSDEPITADDIARTEELAKEYGW
jgi:hypothetical protein